MKKLASIEKIISVESIEGADKIVKIKLLKDNLEHILVTQKTNNFEVGSLTIYFEIDSMLPISKEFNWLETNLTKSSNGIEGYRITPFKRKGIVSDGLCLPINYLEEVGLAKIVKSLYNIDLTIKFYNSANIYKLEEGIDLTEELNMFNY